MGSTVAVGLMVLMISGCVAAVIAIILFNLSQSRSKEAARFEMGDPVLSWQDAERMAAEHMRLFGFSDARTTRGGADGGLDVVSEFGCAQVKYFSSPVGRPQVQALRGAAHRHEHALFYALTGYTPTAIRFADEARVALWQFDQFGAVWPVNGWANGMAKPHEPKQLGVADEGHGSEPWVIGLPW